MLRLFKPQWFHTSGIALVLVALLVLAVLPQIASGKVLSPVDYTLTLPDLPSLPSLPNPLCPASGVHSIFTRDRPLAVGYTFERGATLFSNSKL